MAAFTILVALMISPASASCTDGTCAVDDVTSFIQAKAIITPGDERLPEPEELMEADARLQELLAVDEANQQEDMEIAAPAQEAMEIANVEEGEDQEEGEKFTLGGDPTPPPGCVDKGCYGTGPFCGGNENFCTSRGFVVTGYYKTCGAADACQQGYKVRCALCDATAGVTSVTAPTAGPMVAAWVAPTFAPDVTPTPPTAAPVPVMPTDQPVYAPVAYDSGAVKAATAALAAAKKTLADLQKNLTKAQQDQSKCQANITFFQSQASKYKKQFVNARQSAVTYSKKVQMANVTIFNAQQNMNNAFFAQKGAEQGAQAQLAQAKNFNAQKRYYMKQQVDAKFDVQTAQRQVNLGRAAVKKANYDMAQASKKVNQQLQKAQDDNKFKQSWAAVGVKTAQVQSVKGAMEDAFVAGSTAARNVNNTPPWGNQQPAILSSSQ